MSSSRPALLDGHVVTGIAPGPRHEVDRRLNDAVSLFTCVQSRAGESSIRNSGGLRQPLHSNHVVEKHQDSAFRRLADCHLPFGGRTQRHVGSVVDGGGVYRNSAADRRSDLLARS